MTTFSPYNKFIPDENAMCDFGGQLIRAICRLDSTKEVVIHLNGDLGAGKTTISRGMIQGLGYQGKVKSPTYTLVEEYQLQNKRIYHFDLYRLADPEELEFMGIREYFKRDCIVLIEWAEKGRGILPPPDLILQIDYCDSARNIALTACSAQGENILNRLAC
ncbi:tRNA (adenosine(37)-N6)-threonylcarbamoyltransferase complex ATPase subunit type 1 TsaE [Mesocricetibacter intestinalis]|uniref:tRNA (adenosine(37)-N6)-threonylcarbamoyltransferase complex ATPase subunit type 1 TsaE n=1 Tax=Mesocricetibacter intestinalis TaxID=1521930 RepID=UPI001061723D|nr:tRNA (adenosine(37)-N6)-threonylcarbamoyltransferase complex ATPase subunit type 1 TsaE [Mesocricetibacter intestinalis]